MSESARPTRKAVLRDWGTWLLGIYLVLIQSGVPGWFPPPDKPNDTLAWIGMALVTVQGGASVASWVLQRLGGTGGLPSEPAPPASPGPSAQG